MTIPRSVADVLNTHTRFEVECIDRMYLNVYVPGLQYAPGLVLQRQFVMSMFVVAGAGSGLAGAAPVRPVPDMDEGVPHRTGDAVEQSPDLVDCQRN
ncbi:hypothetical protein [Rhodococcus opacus]|uniref:Uncharacterized protein n=1 Tax=Rhodococcus opacus TaxID=37919 RepID=A0AAX3YVB2_RHOOP|nr:hypothetical protein [Rhodococcus opacus]WLF52219.1 hypothetical protein Q5707_43215 [Rhodococcus opacus]